MLWCKILVRIKADNGKCIEKAAVISYGGFSYFVGIYT